MKAFVLFLVRVVTGLYLVVYAASKVLDTPAAIEVSDKLYMGYASTPVAQHGLAALGAVLGIFVILGFLRSFSYGTQFVVLLAAAAALAKATLILPLTIESAVASATLLLPVAAMLVMSLVLLEWLDDDFFALDRFIDWRKSDLAQDAANAAALKVPVAAAAVGHEDVHAEPVHAEPPHEDVIHEEPAHDDHGHVEAAHEDHAEPVHEEPVHAEPAHEEPVHEVPVHEELAHEEPVHEELAHDEHEPHGEEPHAAHAEASHDEGHGHDDHGHHAEPAHDDHAERPQLH